MPPSVLILPLFPVASGVDGGELVTTWVKGNTLVAIA